MARRYGMFLLTGIAICALAACGGGDGVETETVAVTAVPVASTGSGTTTVTAAAPKAVEGKPKTSGHKPEAQPELKPLDLSDMRLWNWDGKWHASEWDNDMGPVPWKYEHVRQNSDQSVDFILNARGAPQLQAMKGTAAHTDGLWETEVTLPRLRDGVVVAPLWLYNSDNRDEIDFEFAGRKGLDVSLHAYPNGIHRQKTVRLFEGQDLSGKTLRFGISVDMAAGEVEMIVDDQVVHVFRKANLGWFVTKPLRPWIEMWPADPGNAGFVDWVGKWQGMTENEEMRMRVHGYGYSE